MKPTSVVSISTLTAGALTQTNTEVFEAANFNITEALIHNGVNLLAISELSGLIERTLYLSPRSIAVSILVLNSAYHNND
jgi:hypothetical protein